MANNYSVDSILLERLQKNDFKAFEYLYNVSRNRLYVLSLSILNDEEAAKDLVQDFFIDLWYHQTFKTIKISLPAYLFQGVRNRSYNLKEKEQTLTNLKKNLFFLQEPQTHYPLENQELSKLIDNAISKLPVTARRVFRMQYLKISRKSEIAQKLGISRHTVSNHIDQALKELRSTLKKNL